MTTDIDLTPFCAVPERAYNSLLCEPFTIGAHTYATDAHTALRIPARAYIAEPVETARKSLSAIVGHFGPADLPGTAWHPCDLAALIADHPDETYTPCRHCEGQGKRGVCSDCDGHGHNACDCEHCTGCQDCETCDATGKVPVTHAKALVDACDWCEGAGCDAHTTVIALHDTPPGWGVATGYLRRIAALPGPVEASFDAAGEPGPTFWRGPGWTAILMPRKSTQFVNRPAPANAAETEVAA